MQHPAAEEEARFLFCSGSDAIARCQLLLHLFSP
jgi:hypothetical protein